MKSNPKWWQWFLDPFEYLREKPAVILALAAMVITGFLGYLGQVNFGGALDFKLMAPLEIPLWLSFSQIFVNWFSLAIMAFLIGKWRSTSQIRSFDFFYTMAFARWPLFLIPLLFMCPGFEEGMLGVLADAGIKLTTVAAASNADKTIFYCVIFLSLIPFAWSIALIYQGFRISSNLKGRELLLSFLGVLLSAEILSKLVLQGIQSFIA